MKIFNILGWLVYLERIYRGDGVYINHYLFYFEKPRYQSTSIIPDWKNPTAWGILNEGWNSQLEAIHIELLDDEIIPDIPITEPYYFLDEGDKTPPLYGKLIIENNKISFKEKKSEKIKFLSRLIVEDVIEKIFQKHCFEHRENNWVLPRSFPDIIKDVKEELVIFFKNNNWLRKDYKSKKHLD